VGEHFSDLPVRPAMLNASFGYNFFSVVISKDVKNTEIEIKPQAVRKLQVGNTSSKITVQFNPRNIRQLTEFKLYGFDV
jgi:hypothetical protein